MNNTKDEVFVVVPIPPIGKPRMTQRDKWQKRPAVLRYRAMADALRIFVKPPPDPGEVSWKAYFPIPSSWTNKKKAAHAGMPHRTKPDRDNIDKAILDALFKDDSVIYTGSMSKFWDDGKGPRIELTIRSLTSIET